MCSHEGRQIGETVVVGVDEHRVLAIEIVEIPQQCSRGSLKFHLMYQFHLILVRAGFDKRLDQGGKIMSVDEKRANPDPVKTLKPYGEQGLTLNRDQALR